MGIVLSLFSSCSSDDSLKNEGSSKISAVLKEENYDAQQIMYRMLSNEEKLQIWQDKIDNMILNDGLNEKQITLVQDLKSHLSTGLFDDSYNNDEREIFKNVYVKDFLEKSQNLFTPKYFAENFYSLSNKISDDKPNCSCNQSSIWSCAGQSADCQPSGRCTSTTDGCGFLTMYECNGRCYVQ